MKSLKRINLADAIEGKAAIDGPEFIRMTSHSETTLWALADRLTVADWRVAQRAAIHSAGDSDPDDDPDDDELHSLRQFRMATLVLAMAERDGLPEDAIALPTLRFPKAIEVMEATPQLHMQGADGIWRHQKQLTQ